MTTDSPRWFTSSYSSNGGNCVEVATNVPGTVPVRDTKDRDAGTLTFRTDSWSAFVQFASHQSV
ncbi:MULTISPECIES: DUF397 domain-containing protein [Streptomyces]|uniref:DUF397 domain-containing protein n=1 Tax=Streptomyces TaxID=1883 RepID=UPI00081E7B11|nr:MULTISPECIES: DUF397 domain-containing protein [unclassified Streptomyces]MBJ7001589.1 DUF397 domain-containing protein [Streptomyces sp. CRPSP2-6A1]MYQ93242.1 DUF397 domain-containing protein [Streptomyces sp. SID4946]SCF80344.1 protein of unknown function [Streptomyces sp. DconLS]SCF93995.1 protein of unknown function [Streptomyces sp. LamerLS-31b]